MKKLLGIRIVISVLLVSALVVTTACAGNNNPPQAEAVAPPVAEAVPAAHGDGEPITGGPFELSEEDRVQMLESMFNPETVQIIVNGQVIDAPKPILDYEAYAVMLPLVPIAEALGYTVVDNGSEVVIGPGTMVTEGLNSYARAREAPIELPAAPVIHDGVMFVPSVFFQEILSAVAYFADGNVLVEDIVE